MKKLIMIAVLLGCFNILYSQAVKEWSEEYNGPAGTGDDMLGEMVVDASGNTYTAGKIFTASHQMRGAPAKIVTVKYDPNGTRIWAAKFSACDTCTYYVSSMAVDVTGNVYILVGTQSIYHGVTSQRILVKYNSAGIQEWVRYPDFASEIAIDQSGNVLVVGYTTILTVVKYNSSGSQISMRTYVTPRIGVDKLSFDASGNVFMFGYGFENFVTIKISTTGTLQWINLFDKVKSGLSSRGDMAVDGSGNVIVTGYTSRDEGLNNVQDSITTIKYTSSGSVAWIRSVKGVDIFRSGMPFIKVKTDAAGNVYVAGMEEIDRRSSRPILLKYNSSGTLQWQTYSHAAFSISVDSSGTVFIASPFDLAKYNTSGEFLWSLTFDESEFNFYRHNTVLKLDNTGNVIVATSTLSTNSGWDFKTVKYSSTGLLRWITTYQGSGSDYDEARSMVVDNLGYVTVSGIITGVSSGKDMGVVRYNSAGAVHWRATHNGTANGDDKINASVVDASGNIYVTGVAVNTSSGADYATIKYNSTGVRQWVTLYNGTGNGIDEARSIAVDNSGNVYVTGSSRGPAGMDYATVKYNSNGVQQWVQRFNGPSNGDDEAVSVAVDGSGNVYVGGSTTGVSTGLDYTTVKYSTTGAFQWSATFNGTANLDDHASSLKIDAAGNVYITGYSSKNNSLDLEFATVKYNSSGAQQWIGKYNNGNSEDAATSLAIDASGNVYVTGKSIGLGTGNDFATVKYNSAGIQQWAARYNRTGNSNDGATAIALDASGNIYVTGISTGTRSSTDFTTVKYNPSGTQLWVTWFDGPGTGGIDVPAAIFVDPLNKIYVAGLVFSTYSNTYDFGTVKYLQGGTSGRTSNELPAEFDLSQNYPNPFNPATTIKFALPLKGMTTLKVYDIAGKEIASLVETDLEAGYHEINFNASELASGVYFYRLTSGSFTDVKKMILVK